MTAQARVKTYYMGEERKEKNALDAAALRLEKTMEIVADATKLMNKLHAEMRECQASYEEAKRTTAIYS